MEGLSGLSSSPCWLATVAVANRPRPVGLFCKCQTPLVNINGLWWLVIGVSWG